jgi:hypothetical protein
LKTKTRSNVIHSKTDFFRLEKIEEKYQQMGFD